MVSSSKRVTLLFPFPVETKCLENYSPAPGRFCNIFSLKKLRLVAYFLSENTTEPPDSRAFRLHTVCKLNQKIQQQKSHTLLVAAYRAIDAKASHIYPNHQGDSSWLSPVELVLFSEKRCVFICTLCRDTSSRRLLLFSYLCANSIIH